MHRPTPDRRFALGRRRLGRTALAVAASSLAAPLAAPAIAQSVGRTKVRFALPTVITGSSSFPVVGKALGFFSKRGIDLEVIRGSGSGPTANLIATGQFDIGIVSAPFIVLTAAKGLPLKAIGTHQYDSTLGVAVLGDGPIKAPKDLEGQKIGISTGTADTSLFELWAKGTGLDVGKVELINFDGRVLEQTVMNKQIAGMIGWASTSAPIFLSQNRPIRFMLYSQYTPAMYGNTFVTTPKVAEEKKDLLQAIMDGMQESLKHYLLKPEETVEVFLKEVPEVAMTATGKDYARIGIAISGYTMATRLAVEKGIGWSEPEPVQKMIDYVMTHQANAKDKTLSAAELYTNDFVGKVKLSEDELKVAQAKTAEAAKLFAKV